MLPTVFSTAQSFSKEVSLHIRTKSEVGNSFNIGTLMFKFKDKTIQTTV